MSDKNKYAESLRRLAVFYQDMVGAAELLDKLGASEIALAELQAQREQAMILKLAAEKEVEQEQLILESIKVECAKRIQDAKDQCHKLLSEAGADAQAIRADVISRAEAEANEIRARRERELVDVLSDVKSASQMKKQLEAETDAVKANKAKLEAKRDAVNAHVEELQKHLAAVKEQIAKLSQYGK